MDNQNDAQREPLSSRMEAGFETVKPALRTDGDFHRRLTSFDFFVLTDPIPEPPEWIELVTGRR